MQSHTNDSDDPSKPCPPVEPSGIFSGIDPRAVLIGTLTDYLASIPLGLVLILVLSFKHSIQFWDENANQALDALTFTPEFLAWAFLLGMLCTTLGGYVAANKAACRCVQHGAFVGLISLLIGFIFHLLSPPEVPLPQWYTMTGVLAAIPSGAIGGWLTSRLVIAIR